MQECQHMNRKIEKGKPELNPIPVKSPWYHLGIDFVGPVSPISAAGNQYILTVSDYFTKFAWAHALPSKEASGVVNALRQVSVHVMRSLHPADSVWSRYLANKIVTGHHY